MMNLRVNEDNLVEWDEMALASTGAYANAATVSMTLLKQIGTAAQMTAGDETLTCAGAGFVAGDVGRTITVKGAGANGSILRTTIASVTSATEVELTDEAETTITSGKVEMSLDNAAGVSLSYVSDSDGKYQGTLPNTVPLVHEQNYVLEISATDSGRDGFRRIPCKALHHEEV